MSVKVKKQLKRPWSPAHQTKYLWLYNYVHANYDGIDKDTFIEDHKRALSGMIEKNPNWQDSSREGIYFMVARYLYNRNNNDRYVKIYQTLGFDIMKKTKEKEEKNELDPKEVINFRDHDFFLNILNNSEDSDNISEHYKYLLLSMLVLQPPIRTSFYTTARYLDRQADEQKNINYVYTMNRGKVHAYLIVNKDKASNYKLYNMDKKLSKIEIIDDSLAKLINNSFVKFPRKFLFEHKLKAISSTTFLKWLRDITGVDGLTVDIMRSSYITWFYSVNPTYGARDDLSKMMRHSQPTASKNYLKGFNDEKPTEEMQNKELNSQVFNLQKHITDLELKLSAHTDSVVDMKGLNKKRNDVLYTANVKGTKPKAATLSKYGITYDDTKKIYY